MMMEKGEVMKWAADVRRHLAAGEIVEFSPRGLSMWPSVRPDRDTVYVQSRPKYERMDIVLGHFITS